MGRKTIDGVLISPSQVVEPIGGYTAKSVTHGQCDTRPMVTFLASKHQRPSISTKSLHLATEAHVCEWLA